jgi:putative FmdB family regulatory protein
MRNAPAQGLISEARSADFEPAKLRQMPVYDYVCSNGHRIEVMHGVNAEGPAKCPVCGAAPMRKAFTAPAVHFKGSGWAKKDRRSSLTRAGRKSDAETSSTEPASAETREAGEKGSTSTETKGETASPKAPRGGDKSGDSKRGAESSAASSGEGD